MRRSGVAAVAGAVVLIGVAWGAASARRRRAMDLRRRLQEDCVEDECGEDGLPLHAYAG